MRFFATVLALTLVASNVAAHGVITEIDGANGVKGVGFGVTDLSGKKIRLFNQASRYIKGDNSLCGSQKLDGKKQTPINFQAALKKATDPKNLATADANGVISMTLFQVNADGAGPYSCKVSADASGKDFKAMEVVTQVPGTKGKSKAANKSFKFAIKLPAGIKCSGPGDACLIQCKSALNQPFGGCLAVGQSGGAAKAVKAVAKAPKALVAKRDQLSRQAVEKIVARHVTEYEDDDFETEDDSEVEQDSEVEYEDSEIEPEVYVPEIESSGAVPRVISRFFDVRAMEAAFDIPTTA